MHKRASVALAALTSLFLVASSAAAQVGANQGLLNPNLASSAELASVPGLDAAAVGAIEAGRPFLRMADLNAVVTAHLPEAGREAVYRRLWLPIDLNDRSDEEILLIPGVGARMLREFREYRPYTAMAQFEREMGKYVDDAELARMARYVEIR